MFENRSVAGNDWGMSELVLDSSTIVVLTVKDEDSDFQHVLLIPDAEIKMDSHAIAILQTLYFGEDGEFIRMLLAPEFNYNIGQIEYLLDRREIEYKEVTNREVFSCGM